MLTWAVQLDYTISTNTMKISAVPLKETEEIPALAVAASSLIEATEEAEDKESGIEDDEEEGGKANLRSISYKKAQRAVTRADICAPQPGPPLSPRILNLLPLTCRQSRIEARIE